MYQSPHTWKTDNVFSDGKVDYYLSRIYIAIPMEYIEPSQYPPLSLVTSPDGVTYHRTIVNIHGTDYEVRIPISDLKKE